MTIAGVVLGWATAASEGIALSYAGAAFTLVAALALHAGANLVNDYHDRYADAVNDEALPPYTGGSRMIAQGRFAPRTIALYGYAMIAAAAAVGLALALSGRLELLSIGAIGIALAIVYSAPPLRLSGRGCGELAVALAWMVLVVGSDLVQRGTWALAPAAAAMPFGLLVAAILIVNEFPDRSADAAAGKHTLVVKLGTEAARWVYLGVVITAYSGLAAAIASGALPRLAWYGLLAAPCSLFAAWRLLRFSAKQPVSLLLPAIKSTLLAAHVYGIGLACALFLTLR
ncbi:MAG: prenyltransferase [Burkholderiales bacterium]|nr:prenyltransferase [Burkholderiales bacterium]